MTASERTRRAEVADWRAGLETLHARIAGRFRRAEVRKRVRHCLASLECKNGWQVAKELGDVGPQGVRRLLSGSHWDVEAVRDDLRTYAVAQLVRAAGSGPPIDKID